MPISCEIPESAYAPSPVGYNGGGRGVPSGTGDIGGGEGYSGIVSESEADTVVPSGDSSQAKQAIDNASPGETIFLSGGTYVIDDATVTSDGVTIAGNRGAVTDGSVLATGDGESGGADGAIVKAAGPEGEPITIAANKCRVTGLRVEGPKPNWEGEAGSNDHYPKGITFKEGYNDCEVDNCEGYAWEQIFFDANGENGHLHHCYIHDNPGASGGYGVQSGPQETLTLIEYNYFNRNRHSIAADPGNYGYEARYNIFGPEQYSTSVDQHGPDPAGNTSFVHHNTFEETRASAESVLDGEIGSIGVRGKPSNIYEVYKNWFYLAEKSRTIHQRGEPKVDESDKYDGRPGEGGFVNMVVRDNSYGQSDPPPDVGARSGLDEQSTGGDGSGGGSGESGGGSTDGDSTNSSPVQGDAFAS
jgi:hypothetical protein